MIRLVFSILAACFTLGVYGHGRLTVPATRKPTGYENSPVSGPNGTDFVCRNDPTATSGLAAQTKVTAGGELTMQWDLSADHQGDCAVYIGYGQALTAGVGEAKRAGRFVKIANIARCREYNRQDYAVELPSWLPAGPAVIRWEWYAIHTWPNIEFYTQCADVIVESSSNLGPADLPSYPIVGPQLLPTNANEGPGFRCYWCDTFPPSDARSEFGKWFHTGPPCAFEDQASDRAQCENTTQGTKGHVDPFRNGGNFATPAPVVTPATPAPVVNNSGGSTPAPVQTNPNPVCSNGVWATCGGKNFDGQSCCPVGAGCYVQSEWYSQCRPDGCPANWDCNNNNGEDEVEEKTGTPTAAPTQKEEGVPEFSDFDLYRAWCAAKSDKASCKGCFGKFKTKRGESTCVAPKSAKQVKCKKIKDEALCQAVGCAVKRGKCKGRAFSG